MTANNILDRIGNTPLVRINNLNPNPKFDLFVKLEKFNPGGSVKDRITKYMIETAENNGQLKKGMTVIEATSGNTGIGLALVCRVKGYDLALVMPDTMTRERRQILLALGAKVILSEGKNGMDGAQDVAHEIAAKDPKKYFIPNQFANQANVLAHYETTAEEIWRDTQGKVTHFVAGIGTGGTLMGVSCRLKELNPDIKVIGVQPEAGKSIQGLKNLQTQYVPAIWKPELVDEIYTVSPIDAEESARLLALQEGLFVGTSSGAIFYMATKKAQELDGGVMVAIAPDGGEKYLSTSLCDPALCVEAVNKFGIQCSYKDGQPVTKAATAALKYDSL
ncbi:MAG: PLP-dependent cysteine synthase family protein [Candidatus Bathyarchaeota archaeon]|nr:PLP-dependent cysteine synthase family protein [Candidatus Bathyarchaeum sp.]